MIKDYRGAEEHFREALSLDPINLRDAYPLALTYLQKEPPDMPQGIFFLARSAVLAVNMPSHKQIEAYGKTT